MPRQFSPASRVNRRTFVQSSACAVLALGHTAVAQAPAAIRVRIWCEGTAPKAIYPNDVDGALGDDFRLRKELIVSQSRLGEPDAGLSDAALDATDTLIWWGSAQA